MGCHNMDLKSKEKIAIIDANNFYVSCERLFQPKWNGKPAAVLSNNDGCFIARSNEVKKMGIKMGQPKFLLDDEVQNGIKVFSSNYALYGDMSDRIVNILKRLVPRVEVYSIDESFLDLSHISEDEMDNELIRIKSELTRATGIPFSIGVGPTKTLAKLCNYLSKNSEDLGGTCSYWSKNKDSIFDIPIDEVWGIGRGYRKRLSELNVFNVGDFLKLSSHQVKSLLGVVGLRTWYELNEIICNPLVESFKKSKGIASSRSFGSTQWSHDQIKDAFWTQLKNCHRKLTSEGLNVSRVNIFASSGHFSKDHFVWSKKFSLSKQTDNLDEIWNQLSPHLDDIPTRLWQKCGVFFHSLTPKGIVQATLFEVKWDDAEKPNVDDQLWMTRRDFLSPQWTTKWSDIPTIN